MVILKSKLWSGGNPQPWLFCEIPTHLLFVFVIHMRQQFKHEMKSYKTHTDYRYNEFLKLLEKDYM